MPFGTEFGTEFRNCDSEKNGHGQRQLTVAQANPSGCSCGSSSLVAGGFFMARRAKPWFRKARGAWFVTVEGVQHILGADKKEAFERFYQLMRQPRSGERVFS